MPCWGSRAQTAAPASQSCVDVQIGSARAYDCLSQQWGAAVPRVQRPLPSPDVTVTSPAPAVGSFNQAATREQLGTNFGKSVFPQRPPPVIYVNPLIGPRSR